jgi:hypothetical protein
MRTRVSAVVVSSNRHEIERGWNKIFLLGIYLLYIPGPVSNCSATKECGQSFNPMPHTCMMHGGLYLPRFVMLPHIQLGMQKRQARQPIRVYMDHVSSWTLSSM